MSDEESRTTLQPDEPADRKETTQPDEAQRTRSRSPPRRQKRKDAGFKWKEKRRDEDQYPNLSRGYKDRERDPYKSRDRSRSRERRRSRSPRPRDDRRDWYDERPRDDRDSRRRDDRGHDQRRDDGSNGRDRHRDDRRDRNDKKEKKDSAPPKKPAVPQQEMILVTVNDRLGTKKQIPCLPTDTVKDFKAVVSMMIGRRPHEILLKRQSERPFKDFLTLQDYGVSNNVQLDLEVDTGD